MKTHFDAVIVGAGPAGSSAAIWLAQAGWRVALVEKQTFPRRKVCGECLSASNLPLLETLGMGAAFAALAGPELRQVALMRGNHTVVAELPTADDSRFPWGRALGRETLDTLLLEQAQSKGVQVMQPWALQGFYGGPGKWRCEVRRVDTQTLLNLHAPVAIDAHGSWEALPSERMHHVCNVSDLLAFKANFSGASLPPGLLPVLSFEGGYGGMVLADQGLLTLACCIRRDRLTALRLASPGASAGEVVETLLKRECAGVGAALLSATRVGAWLATGSLATGIRLRADDPVFRIGNAAAEAHPITGEGMSLAFQGAWLLCTHLIGSGVHPTLHDGTWQRAVGHAYAKDWHQQFGPRLRLAAALAHLAMRPALAAPLLALVRAWPGFLPLAATWGGKTRSITTTTTTRSPS
ncbi:MAG: FAD dependent oxidoreductase [Comamonadaceae bacterium]|nr:MAG: FAD dependent oxidoreductase [Comamonadaceae bacterium]